MPPSSPGDSPPRTTGRLGDLRTRVISAVVLAPVVLLAAWAGGWPFALLMAVVAALVMWEWSRIVRRTGADPATLAISGACAVPVVVLAAGLPGLATLSVAFLALGAHQVARARDPASLMGIGVAYACLPAMALVLLRGDPAFGIAAVAYLVAIVWASDIGGYFTGRWIGGPKLWPAVSPKKTWSGSIGSLLTAIAAAASVLALLGLLSPWPVVLAGILSIVSQAGDLAESALKRRFGVKDASNLIPGHGGIMDRIDGLAAASLAAAAVGLARGGADAAGAGLLLW